MEKVKLPPTSEAMAKRIADSASRIRIAQSMRKDDKSRRLAPSVPVADPADSEVSRRPGPSFPAGNPKTPAKLAHSIRNDEKSRRPAPSVTVADPADSEVSRRPGPSFPAGNPKTPAKLAFIPEDDEGIVAEESTHLLQEMKEIQKRLDLIQIEMKEQQRHSKKKKKFKKLLLQMCNSSSDSISASAAKPPSSSVASCSRRRSPPFSEFSSTAPGNICRVVFKKLEFHCLKMPSGTCIIPALCKYSRETNSRLELCSAYTYLVEEGSKGERYGIVSIGGNVDVDGSYNVKAHLVPVREGIPVGIEIGTNWLLYGVDDYTTTSSEAVVNLLSISME